MPAIAWANGHSNVRCEDGTRGGKCDSDPDRWKWDAELISKTAASSNSKFFVAGKPVAVEGDRMQAHPNGEICTQTPINHEPSTSLHSGKFFIGGKRVMRIGSKYNQGTSFDHSVSTGCNEFIIGGPSG